MNEQEILLSIQDKDIQEDDRLFLNSCKSFRLNSNLGVEGYLEIKKGLFLGL